QENVTTRGAWTMSETESVCDEGSCYHPVWIEPDGTTWAAYAVWECCEHADEPKEAEENLNDLMKNVELDVPSPFDCGKPVEYAGGRRALCAEHFEEVKSRSRVRWALFEGDSS